MSIFAKTRQLFELVSIARKNPFWLTAAVWLAIAGSVLAFGFERDFERPKTLCLSVAAAMLIPRAILIWPTWPRSMRVAVLIWLLVLAAAVVFALDPARALIGSFERSQGAFMLVCCTIFALARVATVSIIAPVTLAVSVSGIWALAQFFGLETVIFSAFGVFEAGSSGWQRNFGGRAFASFGNPTALGGWLVIAWVFLFSVRFPARRFEAGSFKADQANRGTVVLPRQNIEAKFFLRMLECALFFGAIGLLLSGARAAWIALFVVALLQLWHKKILIIIGLVAFVAVTAVLFSFRADSVRARVELAGAALSPAEITLVDGLGRGDPYPDARLWLGFGPDLQVVMLEHNLPQRVVGAMPDRAHQMLLDGYLSIGVLGVVSWLGMILALWQHRIASDNGTVFALTAALITWQFGFALSAEKVLCALLLGSMYAPKLPLEAVVNVLPARVNNAWPHVYAVLFAIFSLLSYVPRSFMSLDEFAPWRRPERAIVHFERARLAIMANQGELAARELGLAVALDPWRSDLARAKENLARELGHNSP